MPKTTKPARVALTPRDVEILWSLHEARYLTVEMVEWLHFPQWRDRYAQWQQAQESGSTKRYMPVAQAYHCMRRLEQAQLVRRKN